MKLFDLDLVSLRQRALISSLEVDLGVIGRGVDHIRISLSYHLKERLFANSTI